MITLEKRSAGAWVSTDYKFVEFTFLDAFKECIDGFHSWPALIVGCHLDETSAIAEFFVIEDGVHAEYRLREVDDHADRS